MTSLVHRLRTARFRQTSASTTELDGLLPPPLPLIQLPEEPRLARSGGLDGRPPHLPVRRHVHPESRTFALEPNRIDTPRNDDETVVPIRTRLRVYEYNQPATCVAPSDTLEFDSLFESGNLLRADRVLREGHETTQEYELWIHPDLKNSAYRQWFYFQVRNAQRNIRYQFSLVNLAKSGALFGAGLQPCVYSEKDTETTQRGWHHAGTNVRYDVSTVPDVAPGTNALSFEYEFAYDHDSVYFACLQPYTYTDLVEYLDRLEHDPLRNPFVRRTELCQTIAQNACDLVSITSPTGSVDSLPPDDKKLIVISARVHPGEPNASWMMKGMFDYLTGPSSGAEVLRNHFVFKIVPMLNPDGVINGNTRVNLAGWDLNRKWAAPVEKLFPTVFHLKRQLANWQTRDRVAIYCDLHGHSINRNIFMYGCFSKRTNKKQKAAMTAAVNAATAAGSESSRIPFQPSVTNDPRVFPMLVAKNSELFSFASCDFKVHKSKLNTARVVVNHELGVINSYTLEASFCGPDFGPRKHTQLNAWDLEDMGRTWCQSLLIYFGLLPYVRALDQRRDLASQSNESVAEPSTSESSERLSLGTLDTALLEWNGDLLSVCGAAISELFASVDLLDDTIGVRGDSCDSDLSGAEDAIPPEGGDEVIVSRESRINGYASAPEVNSHGDIKAIVKKPMRRKSTRRKKSTGSKKSLKKKSLSPRRVEDVDDPPGDDDVDVDADGERGDSTRSTKRKIKKTKKKKKHGRRHRRRKDQQFRGGPSMDRANDEPSSNERRADVVLPEVPGSSSSSRGEKPIPTTSLDARITLPVATPPLRIGSDQRSGARRPSKVDRIASTEPLELPRVAGPVLTPHGDEDDDDLDDSSSCSSESATSVEF